jgi:hypothetical protein
MTTSSYTYSFSNGIYTTTKGIRTKFDWFLTVDLYRDEFGNRQFLKLDKNVFLTKKEAIKNITELLTKYKLL